MGFDALHRIAFGLTVEEMAGSMFDEVDDGEPTKALVRALNVAAEMRWRATSRSGYVVSVILGFAMSITIGGSLDPMAVILMASAIFLTLFSQAVGEIPTRSVLAAFAEENEQSP